MVNHKIVIGHLYPRQMNVYGDMGNVISLRYRLEQRGVEVEYVPINSLNMLKTTKIDILIGGGGQDSNQGLVQNDLQQNKSDLLALLNEGLVCLVICGMYQLFGNKFVLNDGSEVPGIGFFDMETKAGPDRLIGNIVVDSGYGRLVGFENHSGRTYLGRGLSALGRVVSGSGNNSEDLTEGAVYKNVFGSYMHGPGLAKNPALTDELIARSLKRKYGITDLEPLDSLLEEKAAKIAAKRPK